jgi:hypothetical protein
MATGGLYGSTATAVPVTSDTDGLYGSGSFYGGTFFEWFIFQQSNTQPTTPTGGTWSFQTNTGTPPSGWSNAPPSNPTGLVWVSIAFINSITTSYAWSTPALWFEQGTAGQVAVGTTTTLSAGSPATVNNSGTAYNAVLNFGIPQGIQGATGATGPTGPTGPTGATGAAATIAVGTTTTLASGSPATVSNSGSSSAATFNFGIPQGIPGTAATIAVGTTTTTAPGTSATVTNSGTSGAAVFNFGIPKGAGVAAGGTTSQALIKNSNADYDTTWATITGVLAYQGTWNASTNTPTLTSSVGTNGYYYVVNVAGTTNLNGITDWQPNDWAIFNGTSWEKIDNSDLVTSVNGYTGAVVLTNTDVGAPTYTGTGASGTWGINVTGNAGTVTNGVYTTGSYSNPSWITALAGSKVTAIPNSSLTNSSLTIGSTNIALGATSTSLAGISQITWSGSVSGTSVLQASPVAGGAISILPNVAGILVNTGGTGVVSNTMLANSSITINGTPTSLGGSISVGTVTSVTGSGVISSSGGTTPAISISQATTSTSGYLSSTDWNTFNNKQPSGTYVTSVTGTTGRTTSSGGTTPAIDLASGIVTAGTTGSSLLIPVITVDTYGRVTNVTTSSNPQGTVTSVSGTGTVNGITLTGTVTSSGSLTLGGTLGSIANSQLTNSSITFGATSVSLGSTVSAFNAISIGATTRSSGDFTTLSANTVTSTTPVLSFNASNSIATFGSTTANSYNQLVIQNLSNSSGASTNYVISNNLGTDSTYYGEFGMNSSIYTGAGVPTDFFSINNGIYFSGHDGDITVGSGNGKNLYLAWGTSGQSAHVVNSSGAIGLNTNLAAGTGSGTTNFGTAGQVITSQGSSATPTWTTLSIGGGTF